MSAKIDREHRDDVMGHILPSLIEFVNAPATSQSIAEATAVANARLAHLKQIGEADEDLPALEFDTSRIAERHLGIRFVDERHRAP